MAGKVLLINHGAALLTDTLISGLKSLDVPVVRVEPTVEEIEPEKDSTDVFLLFAGSYMYDTPELLPYLRNQRFRDEKPLCIAGYSKEIAEIEEVIPKNMIDREFVRPIDVKYIAETLYLLASADDERKRKRHILLVDDDITFLKMMQNWFSGIYRTTVVKSGMQAITYLASHTPDLVLLDYEMPITTGAQILSMIRSEPATADLPVVFLTGRNDRESIASIIRLKPEGYLRKSMSKEEIMTAVARVLDNRH